MISKKVKIISTVAVIVLIAVPIFFKKEKKSIEVIESTSSSGIKSSLINTKSNSVIHISCKFKGAGVLSNDISDHGISAIVSRMLFTRIDGLNPEGTIEKLAKLGIKSLLVESDSDDLKISFFVNKDNMKEALEFLSLAFKKPTFTSEDLQSIKGNLPDIPSLEFSHPEELALDKLFGMLFVNHPYGMNVTGTSQVISGMIVDKVLSFIKSKLCSDNLHVIITGEVSRYEASTILDLLFGSLSKSEEKDKKEIELSAKLSEEKVATIVKPELDDIAYVVVGVRLDRLSEEEQAATKVILNALFSKYGDFTRNLKSSDIKYSQFKAEIWHRSLASIFTVSTYVKKADLEKYQDLLDKKFKQYLDWKNLDMLDDEREYFSQAEENGYSNLSECSEEKLPYDDVSKETFAKIMKKLFNFDARRTVIYIGD